MPPEAYLTEVRTAFAFIEKELGFRFVHFEPPVSFDNATVEFRSPTLAVAVVRERGQSAVQVGPAPVARYDLDLFCRILGDAEGKSLVAREAPALSDLARVLRRNLPEIERRLAPPRREATVRELKRAGETRANELFG